MTNKLIELGSIFFNPETYKPRVKTLEKYVFKDKMNNVTVASFDSNINNVYTVPFPGTCSMMHHPVGVMRDQFTYDPGLTCVVNGVDILLNILVNHNYSLKELTQTYGHLVHAQLNMTDVVKYGYKEFDASKLIHGIDTYELTTDGLEDLVKACILDPKGGIFAFIIWLESQQPPDELLTHTKYIPLLDSDLWDLNKLKNEYVCYNIEECYRGSFTP